MAASDSGRRRMNSSTLHSVNCLGTSPSTRTSDISNPKPISRAKIMSFLATSMPDKSSRGSGSVKPFALAVLTIEEKASLPSKTLKR